MSGRGTAAGIGFQGLSGAILASFMLAKRPLSTLDPNLRGTPLRLLFEVIGSVDDIVAETDIGTVFVQAKTSLSLSRAGKGEFYSAVSQFVSQYRAGIVENGVTRPLDVARDFLVLSVTDGCVATIADNLRNALNRKRTGAATGLSAQLQSALTTFGSHLEKAWLEQTKTPIPEDDLKQLERLAYIVKIGNAERGLAIVSLADVVKNALDVEALFSSLQTWAVQASATGTGGDNSSLRRALSGIVELDAPPDYRTDIAKFLDYSAKSADRLRRFTTLSTRSGEVSISRAVTDVIVSAAANSSILVVGEPGAGKSAIIHAAASKSFLVSPTIVLTVDPSVTSLEALRIDIGLTHNVVNVLNEFSGPRPAYLFIDALDAARGGAAEAAYRNLIEQVSELDGWHIIASVRTFDLKMGVRWKKLFRGSPFDASFSDPNFPTVRHVHVPLLSDAELNIVSTFDTNLAQAINSSDQKFLALIRNPFNLSLLADLLMSGMAPGSFEAIQSRGELLECYWQEHVTPLGLSGSLALKNVMERMLARRAIEVPETAIDITAAVPVDNLRQSGVLSASASALIAFRHHILFDFAASKLLLQPDRSEALAIFKSKDGIGLLLAPAIGYWIEAQKTSLDEAEYWTLVIEILNDQNIDPIIKVEISRLVTEGISADTNLNSLKLLIEKDNTTGRVNAFGHLVGAIAMQLGAKKNVAIEPWASLLGEIKISPEIMSSVRFLLTLLIDRPEAISFQAQFGKAARTLLEATFADPNLIGWLSPTVIPFVTKTFGTDIGASRKLIERLFEQSRFSVYGHVEIPWLARGIYQIAEHDPDLTVAIYQSVFQGGPFSAEQKTMMGGGWIMPLTSNAAQDFRMACYSLSENFTKIMDNNPATGCRVVAATLQAERVSEHELRQGSLSIDLICGSDVFKFTEDNSSTWAWNIDEASGHEDYAKIQRTFLNWIGDAPKEKLPELGALMLSEGDSAIIWKTYFEAAARRPEELGKDSWPFVRHPEVLICLDTRQAAIELISKIYVGLPEIDRAQAEHDWLNADFSRYTLAKEARLRALGTLFAKIGEVNLVSTEAKSVLAEAQTEKTNLENEKPFQIHTSGRPYLRDDRLKELGVNVEDEIVARALTLADKIRKLQTDLSEVKSVELSDALYAEIVAVFMDVFTPDASVDPHVEEDILDAVSIGIGELISCNFLNANQIDYVVSKLLELSKHSNPTSDEETERHFAQSPSWGTPAPRIQAAFAIDRIKGSPGLWERLASRYEDLLLNDPHPAIRQNLAHRLTSVWHLDKEAFWRLLEAFVLKEQNTGVLQFGSAAMAKVAGINPGLIERLTFELAKKMDMSNRQSQTLVNLFAYFAIAKAMPLSRAMIDGWVKDFSSHEHELSSMLHDIRSDLTLGFEDGNADQVDQRNRAYKIIDQLIAEVEPLIVAFAQSGKAPTPLEETAIKLFTNIGEQFYYIFLHTRENEVNLEAIEQRDLFLQANADRFRKLVSLGTPHTVHHMLELFQCLVPANPELCFDLMSDALLRPAGIAKYEYESMGATLFIAIVGLYLADYRHVFVEKERRVRLIECITVFVEAGWPDARTLFQQLPELLN